MSTTIAEEVLIENESHGMSKRELESVLRDLKHKYLKGEYVKTRDVKRLPSIVLDLDTSQPPAEYKIIETKPEKEEVKISANTDVYLKQVFSGEVQKVVGPV